MDDKIQLLYYVSTNPSEEVPISLSIIFFELYTLKDLKKKLAKFAYTNEENFKIHIESKGIFEDEDNLKKTLSQLGLEKDDKIKLEFDFMDLNNLYPNFQQTNVVSFVDNLFSKIPKKDRLLVPKYREIREGLNYYGICLNTKCKANGKEVICPIGYYKIGKNDLLKKRNKCPLCKTVFKIKRFGFYKSIYYFNATVDKGNNSDEKLKYEGMTEEKNIVYINAIDDVNNYKEISIEVISTN